MLFHLTDVEKGKIVALKREGYSNAACAAKVGRSVIMVCRWRRFEEECEDELKRNWTGSPRSTPAEDAAMAAVSSLSIVSVHAIIIQNNIKAI